LYPLGDAVLIKSEQFVMKPISLTDDPSSEDESRPILTGGLAGESKHRPAQLACRPMRTATDQLKRATDLRLIQVRVTNRM
jgi:plasmid stability protein